MSHVYIQALLIMLEPMHMLFLCLGTMLGLTVGLIPGLGGIAGLSMVLPFVYGMDPTLALPMMVGLTATTTASDTFPAVMMGIPGTAGSAATVVDGYPLAKRGEAARALGAAFSAALIGGLFGAVILTATIYVARPLILAVGFGEQLMLIMLALTMIGMLTGASAVKGIISCGLGLLIGSIGAAPATGEYRLTFDTVYLTEGVPLVIVALGMFAVPEMINILRLRQRISSTSELTSGWMRGFWETLNHKWLVLRCSAIGTLLGALPGMGGAVIDWVAYGHLVQTTKDRSMLGNGDIRGVIAPEAANNAKEGGALVPTLMFGIPGSGVMAVFLSGLVLIGVEPGIGMVQRHLDLTFIIIWSIALAHIIAASTCLLLARPIARLTLLPYARVAPFMVTVVYFAAFQATRSWYDLIALFVMGILGMYMKRFGWSRPALLIGYVLSKRLDAAVYQSIQVYGLSFLDRPGVQILLGLIVVSVILSVRMKLQRPPLTEDGPHTHLNRRPQVLFLAALTAFVVYAIYDTSHLTFLAKVFPISVSVLTLALMCGVGSVFLTKGRPSYLFNDSERGWTDEERPAHSDFYFQAWVLGLPGSIAVFGFVLGIFAYITVFLRTRGGMAWHWAAAAASSAVVVLSLLSHFLVLDYPKGILQALVHMPWPFN